MTYGEAMTYAVTLRIVKRTHDHRALTLAVSADSREKAGQSALAQFKSALDDFVGGASVSVERVTLLPGEAPPVPGSGDPPNTPS